MLYTQYFMPQVERWIRIFLVDYSLLDMEKDSCVDDHSFEVYLPVSSVINQSFSYNIIATFLLWYLIAM